MGSTHMTRKQALQALLDKIVAGQPVYNDDLLHVALPDIWLRVFDILSRKSLDAARSLHEAVRPGEIWMVWKLEDGEYGCNLVDSDTAFARDPAVAWLIALITGEIEREE